MIRIAIATAVVGGALAAYSCFFACGTGNAVAGTSTEVADGADSNCEKESLVSTAHAGEAKAAHADCDKSDCDKGHCDRAKTTTVADSAPADGDDTPCKYSQPVADKAVLASTTKVVRVEAATCGSCIVPIREQLTTLAGIADIQSGEDYKDIVVTLKPKAKTTDEQILAAVKRAGYTGVIKAQEAPKQS